MTERLITYDPATDREMSIELDPERSDLPPGNSDPSTWNPKLSTRKDFTQAELADILKTSDRTIRNYLAKLKEIFHWQVEDLTLPNGRYSQFALTELVKLQQAIAPYVPLIDNGEVKLAKNPSRISFDRYRESVWEQEGRLPAEETGAIVHVSSSEDVYAVEVLEESLDTLQETKGTIGSSYAETLAAFRQMGRQLGSEAVQAMATEFQDTIAQGMQDLAQTGKVEPKRRKKSQP
jgi:HTH domain